MTGSLRLSALLLLLLSRWASADLEKGEDDYVRSWVIIEEQLVPPSRDEPLATGGVGAAGGGVGGGVAGRRITPKSVFVAPSFNKCSDGYRPDSMGRCVKVVKINQAAQWDFLIKQLNSMYGSGTGGPGFPMLPGASAYQPATTTTTDPPAQKTDSPGPFQLNIPLGGGIIGDLDSSYNQTMDTSDELTTTTAGTTTTTNPTTTTTTTTTTTAAAASTTVADDDDETATTDHHVTTTVIGDLDDRTAATVTATAVTTDTADTARPRPYRNRYQTTHAEDATTVTPPSYDSTTTVTYAKTKYAESSKTTIAGTEDSPHTSKTTASASPSSSFSSPVVTTTTAVDMTETDNPVTAATPPETEEEDVVTVLAVAADAAVDGEGGSGRPVSTTRFPYTTGGRTQTPVTDTVTPEYYDDQPEEPTSSPEPDCSAPNAYLYYAVCAGFRQQQQFEQLQQQQQLLQQHQQQQQLYQQQQQQFYQQQQHNHMATALVKRPAAGGGGVQVRFPGDEDPSLATMQADSANLIRFPGPAPYRTTNKMYESSRHPTWWPTGWPDQQQQQQRQQQQPDDSVQQQHRLQHHLPQQKQDVRLWEFGSRLPKTTSTTTVGPPPPTQWYHRFF